VNGSNPYNNYELTVQQGVYSSGGALGYTTVSPNYFYDCPVGVYSLNYSRNTGIGSYMVTAQDNTGCCSFGPLLGSKYYGYKIQTWRNQDIDLLYNTIINTDYGMSVKIPTPTGPTATGTYPSPITMDDNVIQAKATIAEPLGSHYVEFPIWIDVPLMGSVLVGTPYSNAWIKTDVNTINDAYNGIYINGANFQKVSTNSNFINTIEYPNGYSFETPQFGIYHSVLVNDQIMDNVISGTDFRDFYWEGVQLMHGMNHQVNCNQVGNIGVGFEFSGTSLSSTWVYNNMIDNSIGFILGGIIGPQGDASHQCNNHWSSSGSGFSWSANYQTFTKYGVSPTSSALWVVPGTSTEPLYNGTNSLSLPCTHTYGCSSGSNGINVLPAGTPPHLEGCDLVHSTSRIALEQMVKQNLAYSTNQSLNYWIGQYSIWEAMQRDPHLADSSEALIAFSLMANNSRFSLFTKIENALYNGQIDSAQIFLDNYGIDDLTNNQIDSTTGVQMADETSADRIVINYRHFYQLYINYVQNSLTASDSAYIEVMAKFCPITDGAVIYKTRALYDLVFDTLRFFPNSCKDDAVFDSSAARQSPNKNASLKSTNDQNYTLYPNPNDGNFIIHQNVSEPDPVTVEIWDAVGRSVYKKETEFTNSISYLNLINSYPGVYLLRITDHKGKKYNFKFAVE